jgi:hypothetical protein
MKKDTKKVLSKEELEALEILQKSQQKKGKQLRVDIAKGELKEVNEIKEILKGNTENPEEKYNLYYKGIGRILKKYLPAGKEFKEERDLIYDEKNIFLNRGKKKSDSDTGVRGSDGRMTYQPVMGEILDIVSEWASTSQNPFDLYTNLYNLNDKHNYGHENYDKTKKSSKYQVKLTKKGG